MECPIFVGMDIECRAFIAQFLYPQFIPKNTYVFKALEVGMEMYWITKGEVEVLNVTETRTLTKLRKGDFVGEISLFPSLISYRTSSVRSIEDTTLLELRGEDLEKHVKPFMPDIYEAIKEIATVRFKWLDTEPIIDAMAARSRLRCSVLHSEARSYEEQRLAILKKEISENSNSLKVFSSKEGERLAHLLKPIVKKESNMLQLARALKER